MEYEIDAGDEGFSLSMLLCYVGHEYKRCW